MIEILKDTLSIDIETLKIMSVEELEEIKRICKSIAGRKSESIREVCGES